MDDIATQGPKLHTAEHILARCLQMHGLDLKVRKVDTQRPDGTGEAFLVGIVPIKKILEAEQETNRKINEGLEISSEEFGNVEKAREKFPMLRFNKEMLSDVQGIRVIKIGNFDFAACAQHHVSNTKEILAFAVSNVSYPGGETKIMFRAGLDAVRYSLLIKGKVLELASSENFDAERISDRYEAAKESLKKLNADADDIIETMLLSASSQAIYVKSANVNLFYSKAGDYVKKNPGKCVVVFSDTQLFGLKGSNCSAELDKVGEQLKKDGAFVGAVKADSISGKVLDIKKVQERLAHMA